jgi:hypothetical protein
MGRNYSVQRARRISRTLQRTTREQELHDARESEANQRAIDEAKARLRAKLASME